MILEPEITGLNLNSDIVAFNKLPDHYESEFHHKSKCNNCSSILVSICGIETSNAFECSRYKSGCS